MGRGDSADRDDGVDGRVLAELPAAGRQSQRARAGADQGQRAVPRADRPAATWRPPMPANSLPAGATCIRFLPEIILTVVGTLLMVLDPIIAQAVVACLRAPQHRRAAGGARRRASTPTRTPGPAFGGMLMVDGFATFFRVLVIVVGILTVLPSYRFLERQEARDRRVSRAAAVLDRRAVPDGGGQRPDHDLHRPGDLLDRQLRPGRAICATTSAPTKRR